MIAQVLGMLMKEARKERGEIGYQFTEADFIWNRACTSLMLFSGDKALAALLHFHGLAMNGGVLHALECLTSQEWDAAISGYRFFGFNNVGDFLSEARVAAETSGVGALDLLEGRLGELYSNLIPNDLSLRECFERHLQSNPTHFAPIEPHALTQKEHACAIRESWPVQKS